MNKDEKTIERRRQDVLREVQNREGTVADVISEFAKRHYLSERTIWKDYREVTSEKNTADNNNGSNYY